jgi:hypothetical protein
MNFKKINNLTGWVVFAIATIVYVMTMEKSGSLWDCGEFAATCYKMGIPHPPGAPLFTMIGRIFSFIGQSLGMGPVGGVNLMSALASSFTILFLFWTITHFARKLVTRNGDTLTSQNTFAIMAAGAVGALAYTFSDSFWFSAVEAEVYAMSSLCTAIVFWAILKWEDHPENNNEPGNQDGRNRADKWLIFIFFLMGMSIGVHLLNLLTIPAIVLVYYFKRYKTSALGFFLAMLISVLMLGFVQKFVGQWSVGIAFNFDRVFVNSFGLPVLSGFIFFYIILAFLFYLGLRYAHNAKLSTLRLGIWCLAFTFIGMSTYMTTMIRSKANPGIDMYNVDNPNTLKGYLSREQYGDFPLLRGQHYNSQPVDSRKTGSKYVLRKDTTTGKTRYVFAGYDRENVYERADMMLFPRMWDNNDPNHVNFYKMWLNKEEEETPTGADNFKWFTSYQVNWMYLRYFMWNFAGKQNDIQGFSSKRDGNWISGISFIDNARLGDQSAIPDSLKNNKANNKLYFLPLILGLIGFFYQLVNQRKDWTVTLLMFFMTGLAIVFYLNQAGPQPRERDYAYVGSFYAFAIWIGLGFLQVRDWFRSFIKSSASGYLAAALCLGVPVLMASQEWDDHDRGKKTLARDLAIDYLTSCPKNAILFTIGDNDTYPLWYAQEIEGIRTDVRVVNTSLLGIDWYLDQLRYSVNESAPFKLVWGPDDYAGPRMDYAFLRQYKSYPITTPYPLDTLLLISTKMTENIEGSDRYFFPSKSAYIDIDRAKAAGMFKLRAGDSLVSRIMLNFSDRSNALNKGHFGVLNVVAANLLDRPICFTDINNDIQSLGLANYLRREGMVYRMIPANLVRRNETEVAGMKMMKEFKFGNAATKGVYYDEENRRHLQTIREAYIEAARDMIADGNKSGAIQMLQHVDKNLPTYGLPYGMPSRYGFNNRASLQMTEVAFEAGDSALAKRIFNETEQDTWQEMRYYFALSNPGEKLTKQNVDAFIAKLDEFMSLANNRQMNQQQVARANNLQDELMKNKLSGFTIQDCYAAMQNYQTARDIRTRYIDKTPPAMQLPSSDSPGGQAIPNTPPPAKPAGQP